MRFLRVSGEEAVSMSYGALVTIWKVSDRTAPFGEGHQAGAGREIGSLCL